MSFARLQALLGLTAGNLITHLRRLDEAGYVVMHKEATTTMVALSVEGRSAFAAYRRQLRELLGG